MIKDVINEIDNKLPDGYFALAHLTTNKEAFVCLNTYHHKVFSTYEIFQIIIELNDKNEIIVFGRYRLSMNKYSKWIEFSSIDEAICAAIARWRLSQ